MDILYGLNLLRGAGVARVGVRATPADLDSASSLVLQEHLRYNTRTSIGREKGRDGALWLTLQYYI